MIFINQYRGHPLRSITNVITGDADFDAKFKDPPLSDLAK